MSIQVTPEYEIDLEKKIYRQPIDRDESQKMSDGSELIPAEVAAKNISSREELLSATDKIPTDDDIPRLPNVKPTYQVTDSGLINAYPKKSTIRKIDPSSNKNVNRYILGVGLAINLMLGLVVLAQYITQSV